MKTNETWLNEWAGIVNEVFAEDGLALRLDFADDLTGEKVRA